MMKKRCYTFPWDASNSLAATRIERIPTTFLISPLCSIVQNTVDHTVNELKFGIQADNTNIKVELVDGID